MVTLVIMRHGESQANRDHVFTGWSDVPLTEKGFQQAHVAGELLKQTQLQFTDVHTSYLIRAIDTTNIVIKTIDQAYIDEHKTWRLNERHYGALRGLNKQVVKRKVGAKQFNLWRRSYKTVPPLLKHYDHEQRYERLGIVEPLGESLQMTYERLMPYWEDQIAPRLMDHHNQLVVAHGSTLRALIKYLDHVSDDDIDQVEVPNGVPIIYQFDDKLKVINKRIVKLKE